MVGYSPPQSYQRQNRLDRQTPCSTQQNVFYGTCTLTIM